MSFLHPRVSAVRALALAMLCLAPGLGRRAEAASTIPVAVLGDPAPGGGVFAGPGFTGWPAAAGNGWVAFRGQLSGGSTSEALVVAHMIAPTTRTQVAGIGQPAPGGGTFRAFVGRPAVNASGDVAFLAELTRADGEEDDPSVATPAGIFLFRGDTLTAVARSGDAVGKGRLDLLGSLDPNADPTDVIERTPALNDGDAVAFVAAIRDDTSTSGAIFLAAPDAVADTIVRVGDRYDGGTFTLLGPPAVDGQGLLVFHGMVATSTEPKNGIADGVLDGIFYARDDGQPAELLVSEGAAVMPLDQHLLVFGDDVSVNDDDDVAFVAGPLNADASALDPTDDSPGVLVYGHGMLTAVAYAGLQIGGDRISSFKLGPAAGSAAVPPTIAADGEVTFLASLNGGSREAVAVWSGSGLRLIHTGGTMPDATPAGGTYAGATSATALDAAGAVVFRARIAGGLTSEALVYQPASGDGQVVVVGDAAPSTGFFAGKPFSSPVMNDDGDVVFRAYLARGPASVGIFRYHDGTVDPVVRSGDPVPGTDGDVFIDLLGQPAVNAFGVIAFAAQASAGVGIYVADVDGIRRVVGNGDPVPGDADATFRSLSQNPAINDSGIVAFRGNVVRKSGTDRVNREAIFLADGNGLRRVVEAGDTSPISIPFFRLHDPVLSNVPTVAFRASLGTDRETTSGLFLSDGEGITSIVTEDDDLGNGISLARVTGDPTVTPNGALAFVAARQRQLTDTLHKPLGPSILEDAGDGSLGLVVAQDMPGPAGGTFRNLSTPAVNDAGHVAFRGSFLPFTGGTAGIFLSTDAGLEPYLKIGEATPAGGRFSSFGGKIAINSQDDVAFTATVTGGSSSTGIFLASHSRLAVRPLDIRLGGRRGHGRIQVGLGLQPGHLSNGVDPTHDPVFVSITDANGALWSVTVNPSVLKRHGRILVAKPRKGSKLAGQLASLRIRPDRSGRQFVSAVSGPIDVGTLAAPISVTLQIGDDSATRVLPCHPGHSGVHCKAP